MRTFFVAARFVALAIVALLLAALVPESADAVTPFHRVFAASYAHAARMARTSDLSLTPAAQDLAWNQVATLSYTGPLTQAGAVYFDGQVLDCGAMGDALTGPSTIDLPWLWFGDTTAHTVEFRVYNTDFVSGQTCPLYAAGYLQQAVLHVQPYAPTTSLTAPTLGVLVKGQEVDVTIDLATVSSGLDWSFGGSVATAGLPEGLAADLANPSADDPGWSDDGVSPQLRVHGTPTTLGTFTTTVAVADGLGGFATVDTTYTVQKDVVVPPSAQTRVGSGSSNFALGMLPVGSRVDVGALARGVAAGAVNGSLVHLTTRPGFSGVIKQNIVVTTPAKTVSLTLELRVRPVAPSAARYRVLSTKHVTQVTWTRSTNAVGYRVVVSGRTAATTSAKASGIVLRATVRNTSSVRVIALGGDGLTSSQVSAVRTR